MERDDDFGDGWFLGRHLQNGLTGLFPEGETFIHASRWLCVLTIPVVYTTPAPKPTLPSINNQNLNPARVVPTSPPTYLKDGHTGTGAVSTLAGLGTYNNGRQSGTSSPAGPFLGYGSSSATGSSTQLPMNQYSSAGKTQGGPSAYSRHGGNNSTVIDETMNVIDEHITSMHKPSLGVINNVDRRPSNDSGSEYSGGLGRKSSYYTNGEESNEEEVALSRQEVLKWSPARVAQYLESSGVERSHCDVFQEEEFSGEVILGLDQSAILLQELKLGSIGRRMKTWAKIRALQEDVKAAETGTKPPPPATDTSTFGRGSQISRQASPSASTFLTGSASVVDNIVHKLQAQPNYIQSGLPSPGLPSPRMPSPALPSPGLGQQNKRPSAASIRGLAHSRQSSIDVGRSAYNKPYTSPPLHGKQASLDRSWTMEMPNKAPGPERSWTVPLKQPISAASSRPVSTIHMHSMSADQNAQRMTDASSLRNDGYASDLDVQKSRQQTPKSGFSDQMRMPSPIKEKRSSAFFWKGNQPPSPQKSAEVAPSTCIVSEPTTNMISQSVTTLSYGTDTPRAGRAPTDSPSAEKTPIAMPPPTSSTVKDLRKGLRTISDAITGREKAVISIPLEHPSAPSETSAQDTSTLGGSSTPSINSKSFDLEDANKSDLSTPLTTMNSAAAGRKAKKATSAYTRGLLKRTPAEQMVGCDQSGWMKKKSSSLMGTWKSRLFVLRGRRLSYYYSENDSEEKGVIDISNHRVLPVENEFITSIAGLTGANASNPSPHNASPITGFSPNSALSTPSSGTADSPSNLSINRTTTFKGDAQLFIFKLVPPRTGLSKGVNFTKPTVHYFAVPSLAEGRLWMAALMKATIDRDETKTVITTYQQKTISLEKARARKERPPELKEINENAVDDDDEEDAVGGIQESEDPTDFQSRRSDDLESPMSSQRPSVDTGALRIATAGNTSRLADESSAGPDSGRQWSFTQDGESPDGRLSQTHGEGLGIRGMESANGSTQGRREVGAW